MCHYLKVRSWVSRSLTFEILASPLPLSFQPGWQTQYHPIPSPNSLISLPHLAPSPHSLTSLPHLAPSPCSLTSPHSLTSLPHLTPSPRSLTSLPHLTPSLHLASFPGSPPRATTENKEEGESLVPFRTWCNGTNVTDISIGKFRRHSRADRPFSYSVYLRVWSLGPLKRKGRPDYAMDDAHQFAGTNFCHRRVRNK